MLLGFGASCIGCLVVILDALVFMWCHCYDVIWYDMIWYIIYVIELVSYRGDTISGWYIKCVRSRRNIFSRALGNYLRWRLGLLLCWSMYNGWHCFIFHVPMEMHAYHTNYLRGSRSVVFFVCCVNIWIYHNPSAGPLFTKKSYWYLYCHYKHETVVRLYQVNNGVLILVRDCLFNEQQPGVT